MGSLESTIAKWLSKIFNATTLAIIVSAIGAGFGFFGYKQYKLAKEKATPGELCVSVGYIGNVIVKEKACFLELSFAQDATFFFCDVAHPPLFTNNSNRPIENVNLEVQYYEINTDLTGIKPEIHPDYDFNGIGLRYKYDVIKPHQKIPFPINKIRDMPSGEATISMVITLDYEGMKNDTGGFIFYQNCIYNSGGKRIGKEAFSRIRNDFLNDFVYHGGEFPCEKPEDLVLTVNKETLVGINSFEYCNKNKYRIDNLNQLRTR